MSVRSGGQLLHFERINVLLHRDDLAVTKRPDVRHLHLGWLARRAMLPRVGARRDHGVVFGDESSRGDREPVADLTESHEYTLENRLRSYVRAVERESFGFSPFDLVVHQGEHLRYVTLGEGLVCALNDLL